MSDYFRSPSQPVSDRIPKCSLKRQTIVIYVAVRGLNIVCFPFLTGGIFSQLANTLLLSTEVPAISLRTLVNKPYKAVSTL